MHKACPIVNSVVLTFTGTKYCARCSVILYLNNVHWIKCSWWNLRGVEGSSAGEICTRHGAPPWCFMGLQLSCYCSLCCLNRVCCKFGISSLKCRKPTLHYILHWCPSTAKGNLVGVPSTAATCTQIFTLAAWPVSLASIHMWLQQTVCDHSSLVISMVYHKIPECENHCEMWRI